MTKEEILKELIKAEVDLHEADHNMIDVFDRYIVAQAAGELDQYDRDQCIRIADEVLATRKPGWQSRWVTQDFVSCRAELYATAEDAKLAMERGFSLPN